MTFRRNVIHFKYGFGVNSDAMFKKRSIWQQNLYRCIKLEEYLSWQLKAIPLGEPRSLPLCREERLGNTWNWLQTDVNVFLVKNESHATIKILTKNFPK